MLLDSENIDEEKQLKLNSLEVKNNELRAIFAVNMLNEGWDVLNLLILLDCMIQEMGNGFMVNIDRGRRQWARRSLLDEGQDIFHFN